MKRFAQALFAGLLTSLAGLVVVQAAGAPQAIQLPGETVKLRPSKLAGFGVATQKCAICHSTDYIAYQPPAMNQAQWTAEVSKMHGTYGAPIDDNEVKLIGIYLAATYGDAKSVSAADLALPAPIAVPSPTANAPAAAPTPTPTPAPTPTPTGAIDVQALLTQNACLSCHAVSQKIVGPAYHDVAVKYKSDPQAVSKLESSIRLGGSGHWGATPMPAFAALSAAQLKALAEFVLEQ